MTFDYSAYLAHKNKYEKLKAERDEMLVILQLAYRDMSHKANYHEVSAYHIGEECTYCQTVKFLESMITKAKDSNY